MRIIPFPLFLPMLLVLASVSTQVQSQVFQPGLRSTDQAWVTVSKPEGGPVSSLLAASNGSLYAGTTYSGVFRSTDHGTTWSQLPVGPFSRTTATSLLRTRTGIFISGTPDTGVVRSSDEGMSWHQSNAGLPLKNVLSLCLDSAGVVWASTPSGFSRSTDDGGTWSSAGSLSGQCFAAREDSLVLAGTTTGIYSSADSGRSWMKRGNLPGEVSALLALGDRIIVAGTADSGIYRSTDAGAHWILTNGSTVPHGRTCLIRDVHGHLFAGTAGPGLLFSADSGRTWSGRTDELLEATTLSAAADAYGLVVGTLEKGIVRSTDDGLAWQAANSGLSNALPQVAGIDSSGTLFVGTSTNGVSRSTDGGEHWSPTGLSGGDVRALHVSVEGVLFAAPHDSGVYRSLDGGVTWSRHNEGIVSLGAMTFASKPGGIVMVGGAGGAFVSTNNGDQWTKTSLPTSAKSLVFSGSGDVYTPGAGGLVFRSTDNGTTWTTPSTHNYQFCEMAWKPPQTLLGGGTWGQGVHRSRDNGLHWEAIDAGLTYTEVSCIHVHVSGKVFAGTWGGGVFGSIDDSSWSSVGSGLADGRIVAIVSSPTAIFCVAQDVRTDGSPGAQNLMRLAYTTHVEESPDELPHAYQLCQNFPNPFNPVTVISYEVPGVVGQLPVITLRIHDILGREVAVLVNEAKPAGRYRVTWDATRMASGVYFYALTAREYRQTKKMVLSR